MYKNSIFIFRRDLRIIDNIGFISTLNKSEKIYPVFIFNDEQIDKNENKYFNNNSVQFMIDCIKELQQSFKQINKQLFIFKGDNLTILQNLMKLNKIDNISVNKDYTLYSKERDEKILKLCHKMNATFDSYEDITLLKESQLLRKGSDFYQKFTPFYNAHNKLKVELPIKDPIVDKNINEKIKSDFNFFEDFNSLYEYNKDIFLKGGRKQALKILNNLQKFKNYETDRNEAPPKTTNLAAYLKFGVISIREVHHAFKTSQYVNEALIRQLYWRDFYYFISDYFPHIYKGSLKKKYDNIKWEDNEDMFNKWKNGETGFPIIDAAMRFLNKTGAISNRLRMVVSNFLVKDLAVDWRKGELYFANKLIDYDPSQNNGGWQWCSGSGVNY